eukprot:NODE_1016_length_697_cov_553.589506_g791_i0.p1 GENE.NODE_1016_length_697_cov_553.589506_g791_i0~~NODE_1016_length_697_cov_553.589506_g791_i0.p1  ORF type:complete len:217 (+),score=38.57 NODE_1016_length_697_cov_553.589506_g791_i0:33-653(+)
MGSGLSPAIILSYLTPKGQWCIFKEFCFIDVGMMEATETLIHWCNMMLPQGCSYIDYGDPAGVIRDSNKGSPKMYIAQKAKEFGIDLFIIDGIQTWKIRREAVAGRLNTLAMGEPAILIDEECETLIEGFEGGYAYRELANLPGMYAQEAVKNKYSHPHDALQYPATRLFTQSNDRLILNDYHDSVEEDDYFFDDSFQGKSAIGGY